MTIGVAMDTVGQGLFLHNIIIELLIHFTPLLWYVFFGVISGPERSSSFIAIIKW